MKTLELVVFAVSTVAALFYMYQRRSAVIGGQDHSLLTPTEKAYVLALVILAPLVSGAIFYYGWIQLLPGKARQANRWSIITAIVLIGLYLALGGR